jgi:hypothetical protein
MKYRFARLAHHRAEAVHPAHVMYAVHRDSIVIVNLPDYRRGATPQASASQRASATVAVW